MTRIEVSTAWQQTAVAIHENQAHKTHHSKQADQKQRATSHHHTSCCHPIVAFSAWYFRKLEHIFACLGGKVASQPLMTIFTCLFLVAFCSLGLLRFQYENRTEKLFFPQNSRSVQDVNRAENHYRIRSRRETVILTPKADQHSFSPCSMGDALLVHQRIIGLKGFTEFCNTQSGKQAIGPEQCLRLEPLGIFGYRKEEFVNIRQKLSKAFRNSSYTMSNGRTASYNFGAIFGGLRWNVSSGIIIAASAVQLTYFLRDPDDEVMYKKISDWESKYLSSMAALHKEMKCMNLAYSAKRSTDDMSTEGTSSDVTLAAVSVGLMIIFACAVFINIKNPVTGHTWLAFSGILTVCLGTLAGFGIATVCGIPFQSIVGLLPSLILGIGIDDMFIIINELDRQKFQISVKDIVKTIMARTGSTITMTTVTDLVALAVSTTTEFPSVRYFCIYAALSLTCVYLLMITFFVAFVSVDIRRIQAGLRALCPFSYAPPPKTGQPPWIERHTYQVSSKLMEKWARFLMFPACKVIVVIISLGLLAGGVYGAINIDQSFDRKVIAKEGTYFNKFVNVQERNFVFRYEVSIVVDEKIRYEDRRIQNKIMDLTRIAADNKHYTNKSLNWMRTFLEFSKSVNLSSTGEAFMPTLRRFLSRPQFALFNQDVKLSKNGTEIYASRVLAFMRSSKSNLFWRDGMLTLREDLTKKSTLPAFAVNKQFVSLEQYVITLTETIRFISITAAAILVIAFPFLLNIPVTLVVFLSFCALIFELFGLMYIWDTSLNAISMIILVIAVGLAVDYCTHIAHAYVTSKESSPEKRVVFALRTSGASVVMGGFSTFLGIVGTAFASSKIFHIFFRMFVGIVLLGLLHALCFLPVYLSIMCRGPSATMATASNRVADINTTENGNDAPEKKEKEIDEKPFTNEKLEVVDLTVNINTSDIHHASLEIYQFGDDTNIQLNRNSLERTMNDEPSKVYP